MNKLNTLEQLEENAAALADRLADLESEAGEIVRQMHAIAAQRGEFSLAKQSEWLKRQRTRARKRRDAALEIAP